MGIEWDIIISKYPIYPIYCYYHVIPLFFLIIPLGAISKTNMICSYLSGCPKVWYLTKCLCFMFSRENYDWSLDCGCVFPNHGHCLHMHQRNRKWFKTHWKIKINWWYSKHINIYPPGIKMTLEKNIYNHINIYPPGIKMILEKIYNWASKSGISSI